MQSFRSTSACVRSIRTAQSGIQHYCRSMGDVVTERPVETSIKKKLADAFQPDVLEVINESHMHNVPKGSESHFKVLVVSEKFSNQPLIKRHRMVNETLQEELKTQIHALSIHAKTPEQWNTSEQKIGQSPPCRGGAGL
ncbi:DNA-binding transcriptional regulator BolA-like isoform X1 [Haliotis cracherodii]|uniref:DNA-binding transcriptional regulator BolA-like isoform X2 n=1 Tax=Haliotis rufescens TaxID=6454 RepID=UPI00201F1661|nr:DNA-binding transcriptional regulator BolA-like isoform X2 [Haliotis rufescens]